MRGLKLTYFRAACPAFHVALLVSAWIEIYPEDRALYNHLVALLVSAWIEIDKSVEELAGVVVALLVSAWIEIQKP